MLIKFLIKELIKNVSNYFLKKGIYYFLMKDNTKSI